MTWLASETRFATLLRESDGDLPMIYSNPDELQFRFAHGLVTFTRHLELEGEGLSTLRIIMDRL